MIATFSLHIRISNNHFFRKQYGRQMKPLFGAS